MQASTMNETGSGSGATNALLWRSTLVAALGGLLFGFDTAVIAGTTRALTETFQLSPWMLGITVSSALWGTVLGSIFAGAPADRYGRRASLRGLAVFYVVSALGCALAWDYMSLVAFRVVGGLAIGASSVIGPMYIAEVAPADKRGRLVALFQFNIVLGILTAYLSNYIVGLLVQGPMEWRWKLGVAAVPAALFFLALYTIPRSPRWLVSVGLVEEARGVLAAIGERDPDQQLGYIIESINKEKSSQNEPLFQVRYRLPILLAVSIGMFNQLSGINAILYYLNDIFERAGFSRTSSDVQAVAIGFTNLIFTLLAMSVIDRMGRKKMLLLGAVGTAVCLAGVATIFATGQHQELLIWFLVAFIAFFAFSQGAVIWVYLSEVFPTMVRAKGQSLGSFTHWLMNAVISGIFPLMAATSGAVPFYVFSGMMVVQFVVVLMFYPETKGVSLEQMQKNLGIK
jgi:MFS transporter, SP family, arabinose:H+ symporter